MEKYLVSQEELKNIPLLEAKKRYEYSVKRITDLETVWALYDDGWALAGDSKGNLIFPIWPLEDFSNLCIKDGWENYKSKSIDLESFLNFLEKLSKDNVMLGVFYTTYNTGIVINPLKFKEDLLEEITDY